MRWIARSVIASLMTLVWFGAAFAQDGGMQGHDMGSAMELPQACQTTGSPPMADMDMGTMEGSSEAQQAMMEGMMRMHGPMMQGVMAADPDVAFACAMIPHHQGAIAMAEIELRYGDAGPMKELAQAIIDGQRGEITRLTQWLQQQPQ